jgi:hypothetical protein
MSSPLPYSKTGVWRFEPLHPCKASNTSRGLSLDRGKSTGNAFSRMTGRFPHTLTGRTGALL